MVQSNPEDLKNGRNHTPIYDRLSAEYSDKIGKFANEAENYSKQFASLYVKRLQEIQPILEHRLTRKWGSDVKLIPLSDIEDQNGERVAIIGTLFKDQPNKPSILQELSEEQQMKAPVERIDYCSDQDQLFLEDQTSRIKLIGENVNVKESVTGVVCAVLGVENEKSCFEVEDWCFPSCPSQTLYTPDDKAARKLVFISGLELASSPPDFALSLLSDWLKGLAGGPQLQEDQASVVRVILAGNNIKGRADQHVSKGLVSGKAENDAAATEMADGIRRLDEFLADLGQSCYVTLMPGQFDITSMMMPQRAMHPASFPEAKRLKTIKGVTNPWVGYISNRIIIGTSGQPIQDIHKVCGLGTRESIDWLEKTLEWAHMCPTAPDTIPCLPYYTNDPFVLKECPDIYFAGNMEKFATKLYQGPNGQQIRLICIPKFSETKTIVIVDIDNLTAIPYSFGSE